MDKIKLSRPQIMALFSLTNDLGIGVSFEAKDLGEALRVKAINSSGESRTYDLPPAGGSVLASNVGPDGF